MAEIVSIDIKDGEITTVLTITKKEYKLLGNLTKNLILLPAEMLEDRLTTGTLGNSNRIMLPNRLLGKHNVTNLLKKLPANVFELKDGIYLLTKLQESKPGIPVFDHKTDKE